MTERQKYLRLLSIVIEDLPTSAIDAAIRAGYPAPASMLNNVRIGRVHNLAHLRGPGRLRPAQVRHSGRAAARPGPHLPATGVMEEQAPYLRLGASAPKGPRNLATPIAAWVRRLGFAATEQQLGTYAAVAAHWTGPRGEHFFFDYTWVSGPVPEASCCLRVLYPNCAESEPLFAAQRVHRVQNVRHLLTGCVRLHNARLLAKTPAPSTTPI